MRTRLGHPPGGRGDLLAEVRDDGRGFDPKTPPGVGLASMRERAVLIDGELEIESEPERGTSVRLRVPLAGKVLMDEKVETREIRVMHVEDHADFRDLMRILAEQPVGHGGGDAGRVPRRGPCSGRKLRNRRGGPGPEPPDGNGLDPIPDLRQANPGVGILVPSANLDPAGSEKAAGTGADEILTNSPPVEVVLESVRKLGVKT